MNEPTRTILWNVGTPLSIVAYAALGLSLVVMVYGLLRHLSYWRRGAFSYNLGQWPRRVLDGVVFGMAQTRLFRDRGAGLMHAGIFWGMLGLLVATGLVALDHDFRLGFLDGAAYMAFKVMANTAGLLLVAGCLLALWRRVVRPVARLERRSRDVWLIVLLLVLALQGFVLEALRILGTGALDSEWYSLPGWVLAKVIAALAVSGGGLTLAHQILWTVHAFTAVGFLVLVPFSKLVHMIGAPAAVVLRSYEPKGVFRLIGPEAAPLEPLAAESLSWRNRLDSSSCTHCGRCEVACPAASTGKPLSPRSLMLKARAAVPVPPGPSLGGNGPGTEGFPSPGFEGPNMVRDEELWSCTTCRACLEECPVFLEPMDAVLAFRRSLVDKGRVDGTVARGLESTFALGNPWGYSPSQRLDWAFNVRTTLAEETETGGLVYWVGCAGAYEPDGQSVARSLVRLLNAAEVPFSVLGAEEVCCGEPVRRLGEEVLFQQLAEKNVATLERYGAERIVTHCPHCFNTLKHEYRQLGASFHVLHHSELLHELVATGRLAPVRELSGPLAYHDPCYLGRYNDLYDSPRELLSAIPGVELAPVQREREKSFCCGGGGGQMWMSLSLGSRVNYMRFQDFKELGVSRIATACANCKIMMNDAVSYEGLDEKVKVKDVAEWLADSLGMGEG